MARQSTKVNPKTIQIFEDLERFLEFCRDYGYRYNESDLGNWKSYAYQQYSKFVQGKTVKDMWEEDAAKFAGRRS